MTAQRAKIYPSFCNRSGQALVYDTVTTDGAYVFGSVSGGLHIRNATGGSVTVTLHVGGRGVDGLEVADRTIVVSNNTEVIVGPLHGFDGRGSGVYGRLLLDGEDEPITVNGQEVRPDKNAPAIIIDVSASGLLMGWVQLTTS